MLELKSALHRAFHELQPEEWDELLTWMDRFANPALRRPSIH